MLVLQHARPASYAAQYNDTAASVRRWAAARGAEYRLVTQGEAPLGKLRAALAALDTHSRVLLVDYDALIFDEAFDGARLFDDAPHIAGFAGAAVPNFLLTAVLHLRSTAPTRAFLADALRRCAGAGKLYESCLNAVPHDRANVALLPTANPGLLGGTAARPWVVHSVSWANGAAAKAGIRALAARAARRHTPNNETLAEATDAVCAPAGAADEALPPAEHPALCEWCSQQRVRCALSGAAAAGGADDFERAQADTLAEVVGEFAGDTLAALTEPNSWMGMGAGDGAPATAEEAPSFLEQQPAGAPHFSRPGQLAAPLLFGGGARPAAPLLAPRPMPSWWPFSFGQSEWSAPMDPTFAPMFVTTLAMNYPAFLNRNMLMPLSLLVSLTGGL